MRSVEKTGRLKEPASIQRVETRGAGAGIGAARRVLAGVGKDRSAMFARYGSDARRGIALIMVIVVLMALLLIATPFAVSMRDHRVTVTMIDSANRAQEDLVSVRGRVVGYLARTTHFATDETPEVDGPAEFEAAVNLEDVGDLDGVRNSRGTIWSAGIEDEQAKINVNAASPFALANLFGARTVLSEKVSDSDAEIPIEDSSIFDPEGGYVVVGAELIKYSGVQLGRLIGCERGVNAVEEEPVRSSGSPTAFAPTTPSSARCPAASVRSSRAAAEPCRSPAASPSPRTTGPARRWWMRACSP
jgi:hypothetical protein